MRQVALLFFLIAGRLVFGQNDFIHVDQFGYPSDAVKVAVISDPQVGFNSSFSYTPSSTLSVVHLLTGQTVFSGTPVEWNSGQTDAFSGDRGWHFDFSSVTETGSYYIQDLTNNVNSSIFNIEPEPYNDILRTAGRMFFYNRCNFEKQAPFADTNWVDGMNFMNSLQDSECRFISDPMNASLEKDLSGGWFDAGDYNKYVTFTYPTVHDLLYAYEEYPHIFNDDWNLPESNNGLADILDEIKWELDWLLKMTNPDGSTHIKMGSQNYSENTSSPPSANTDQRFYGPTCTSASAVLASNLAHAALIFDTIPGYQTFANQLTIAAENAFNYVLPFYNNGTLELDCDDGSIVSGDADMNADDQRDALIVAAIYLFDLTSNSNYDQFVVSNLILTDPIFNDYWDAYQMPLQDAIFHYRSMPTADPTIVAEINNSVNTAVLNNWTGYYGMNDLTLYRDHMPDWAYHWGSNRVKSNFANLNLLVAANQIGLNGESQRLKAKEMLHSFHGVNPLNLVYLSNMYKLGAESSVNEIYHTWFYDGTTYDNALLSLHGPAPGYVVGGPNRNFSVSSLSPPYGQPDTKSYLDFNTGWPDNSWEVSEPAIYYQASYIRLLAGVMNAFNSSTNSVNELEEVYSLYPNPTKNEITISGVAPGTSVFIYDNLGRMIQLSTTPKVDLSALPEGIYLFKFDGKSSRVIKSN